MRLLLVCVFVTGCSGANRNGDDLGTQDMAMVTPGDMALPPVMVKVNELFPGGSDPNTDPDWAEIVNLASTSADISGYQVRDSKTSHLMALPSGTILPAGGYLVVLCGAVTDGGAPIAGLRFPHGLSASGDEFHLVSPAGDEIDGTTFTTLAAGKSWGRLPDGTGAFQVLDTPTRGTQNQ